MRSSPSGPFDSADGKQGSDRGGHGSAAPTGAARGDPCDGCHECGLRCTSGVEMTRPEFGRIIEHLRSDDPAKVGSVLEQDKRIVWFEDIGTDACLFYDVVHRGCLIYPVRPFICRLFGRVEWLPCPIGRPLEKVARGLELIQAYAQEHRGTFAHWCAEAGIFDFGQLTSKKR